jgi:hypothetical protein
MTETRTEQKLEVPAPLFNKDGLAVFTLHGTRYGGDYWPISVLTGPAADATTQGEVLIEGTDDPDAAVTLAIAWVAAECDRLKLKIVHQETHNHRYGVKERPFFVLATVILAAEDWS